MVYFFLEKAHFFFLIRLEKKAVFYSKAGVNYLWYLLEKDQSNAYSIRNSYLTGVYFGKNL